MKILLLGEYSNVHSTLAKALREAGEDVTVVSNGDYWKNYPRDIDIARPEGKYGGLKLLARVCRLLPKLRGYDIVQIINPVFIDLKAERILPIYKYLRAHNKAMVMGAFGMDYYWVHENISKRPLRYSDFNIGDQLRNDPVATREIKDWTDTPKGHLNEFIAHDCDAIVTGLYEYDVCYRPLFPEKTTFIPFPISTKGITSAPPVHDPTRVFIGISKGRSAYKGTDFMLEAAKLLHEHHPHGFDLEVVSGLSFDEYCKKMNDCDILLDQLYSYTPAMNALEAMSRGIVCVGGGEPENYEILGEKELRPIVNVEPNFKSIYEQLSRVVFDTKLIARLKQESIEYISRHHDANKVARRYLRLYSSILNNNS